LDTKFNVSLHPIAIQGDWLTVYRPNQEVGNPPLVFGAKLMGPVNTAHAEDDGWDAEGTGVVEDVLVSGSFGTAIGTMEV
jgi:hypothetical protein